MGAIERRALGPANQKRMILMLVVLGSLIAGAKRSRTKRPLK